MVTTRNMTSSVAQDIVYMTRSTTKLANGGSGGTSGSGINDIIKFGHEHLIA